MTSQRRNKKKDARGGGGAPKGSNGRKAENEEPQKAQSNGRQHDVAADKPNGVKAAEVLPVETPTQTAVETAVETPVEAPVETPVETPVQKEAAPVETSMQVEAKGPPSSEAAPPALAEADRACTALDTLLLDGERIGRAVAAEVCAAEEAELLAMSSDELSALVPKLEAQLASATACLAQKAAERQACSAFSPPSGAPVTASFECEPLDCKAIAEAAVSSAEMLPSDPEQLSKLVADTEAALCDASAALERKRAAKSAAAPSDVAPAISSVLPSLAAASAAVSEKVASFPIALAAMGAVLIGGAALLLVNARRR